MRVTVIKARVPKLRCETCDGYPQIPVPWARPRVSYTKVLEREFFTLFDNSANRTAELCRIRPYVAQNIVMYRVNQALYKMDLSGVKLIYIDEISSKKGHSYVIMVCNQDRLIIFICEGKSLQMMDRLAVWLKEYNEKRDNIRFVSYDFEEAYPSQVHRNFPNAMIVYDEFHAVKFIVEAIDNTARWAMKSQASRPGTNENERVGSPGSS